MNGALVGGLILLAYSIFEGINTKDWTLASNARVYGGGSVGLGTILYQMGPLFKFFLSKLPKKQTEAVIQPSDELNNVEVKEIDKIVEGDTMTDESLELNGLEERDIKCLSYLTKRAKSLKADKALVLLKQLNDEFFDAHLGVKDEKVTVAS